MNTAKEIKRAYDAEYYRLNRLRRLKQNRAWIANNKEKHDTLKEIYREKHRSAFRAQARAWALANPARASEKTKRWLRANPAYHAATKARRRAAKLQRTPRWLTDTMLMEISIVYLLCAEVAKTEGAQHCVDHICPLQSPTVCGLHVPWNLQILTRVENAKKHNRWDEVECLPAFLPSD